MKIPPLPQKLEEALNDDMETLSLTLEHTSKLCFEAGFIAGAKKLLKLMENGADYDDLKSEVDSLTTLTP